MLFYNCQSPDLMSLSLSLLFKFVAPLWSSSWLELYTSFMIFFFYGALSLEPLKIINIDFQQCSSFSWKALSCVIWQVARCSRFDGRLTKRQRGGQSPHNLTCYDRFTGLAVYWSLSRTVWWKEKNLRDRHIPHEKHNISKLEDDKTASWSFSPPDVKISSTDKCNQLFFKIVFCDS